MSPAASPLWTLGAVGIYINGLQRQQENIFAEIDILDATETELHWYGAKSARYRLTGTIWGRSDFDTLEGYGKAEDTRTLTGPNSLSVNFKVKNVTGRRIPDKTDVTVEVFGVELELIETT